MFYLTAKFQKKVTNGFRETALRTDGRTDERTDERTNERTNGRDSLGLFSANRRETKKH